MKKTKYVFLFALLIAFTYGFYKMDQGDPNADVALTFNSEQPSDPTDTNRPAGFPFPTMFNFNYSLQTTGPAGGTVGAMYFKQRYYLNKWNTTAPGNVVFVYDSTGPNGGFGASLGTRPYVGQCRDLTHDGNYLYSGRSTTQTGVLYRFDTTWATVTTFTLSGQDIRAIAYDFNRKGFWCCGWATPLTCKDTLGNTKATITNSLAAKYGMGWDSTLSADTAFVWVWDQTASLTTAALHKFHAITGTLLASYTFNLTGSQIGIAGGAEVEVYLRPPNNILVLLLNYQNFAVVGYKMKDILTYIESQQELVQGFKLNQNYPNPFNPTTKIDFNLMKAGKLNLTVYDAAGNLVRTLINEFVQSGDHSFSFDASGLASGVYFYRLTTGDYTQSRKMMLIK